VLADSEITNLPPEDRGSATWAVGYGIHPPAGNGSSLIEFGTANRGWTIVPSPDPAGRQGNSLIDPVQAFGSRNVWAVGGLGCGHVRRQGRHADADPPSHRPSV